MTHICPWGSCREFPLVTFLENQQELGAVPAAPELPGKNYPASRQSQNGNSVSLPPGFHACGFVSPAEVRSRGPPENSLAQHGWNLPASRQPQPNWLSTLSFQKRGKRENVSICPGARFCLACLRMVLTILVLQWKVMSRWAAVRHLHPRL